MTRKKSPLRKNNEKSTFQLLKILLELIDNNKLIISIIGIIFGLLAYYLKPLKEITYSKIWPNNVVISYLDIPDSPCSGCEIEFKINITQESKSEIKKGLLKFELKDGLKIIKKNIFEIPNFEGIYITEPIIVSIPSKFSGKSTIKAIYSNPQITKTLEIKLNVTPQKNCIGPKIVKTDTNRINLTGEWNIDLGADHGTMQIEQKENNKITGLFSFENNNGGSISGYKDGTVFNVFFRKHEKSSKIVRIESTFEINENDNGYIEIKGCAYGIEKNESINSDTESSKYGSCNKVKNYVGWKGVSISEFYATSVINNCFD